MDALDRKLLRDFARLWMQALAIALVMAGGVAVLLMSFGMSRALDETRAAYYERNRFADVFADATRAPTSLLAEIRGIEGVASAEGRVTALATLDIEGKTEATIAYLASLPESGPPQLNVPMLRSGSWPDRHDTDRVVINEPFALANDLRIGDRFHANLNGARRALTVTGTALSPEFIYTIGPGALVPDDENFGIVWMPERALAAAFDRTGAFNNLAVKIRPGFDAEPVMDAVDALLAPYGGLGAFDRADQPSNAYIDSEIEQLRTLSYILPPIFLGITVFLVSMVIGRIVTLERSEIGLLKALGYSSATVCLHYLLLAGMVAVVGVGLGWAVGSWLSFGLAQIYAEFLNFPYLIYSVSWNSYILSALLGFAAAAVGAVRAALRAAALSPAVAMSPPAPTRFHRNWLDRAIAALRFGQPTMMILRSLIRWPVRAALSALGMALAVSVLVASNFFPDSIDLIIDTAFYQSNRQHAMLTFEDEMPDSALQEVRALPGVLQAEGQQFHTAIFRNAHHEKRVVVEARPPGTDLSRIVDASGRVVDAPPGGVMLSARLARQLDIAVGDVVEAEFMSGKRGTYTLPVTGFVTQFFGLGAYMDEATLNAMFQQAPQVSVINITFDTAEEDALHASLRELPNLSGTIMMVENRRSFEETIGENILIVTTIYAMLGILITVGVAYNGARIQLSERARELASLRILGFTRGEVSYVLVGETMLLALIAQPFGWWIGWRVAKLMTDSFASDLYTIPLVIEPATYANASLIVLSAALLSVLVVRRRLDTLNLVSVMKTRE
ncbi:FtsX-like permease family protein [Pontivivens ytuae]|uniref:ABC transporter permease n=1 Tax=Pontivivens ytuae TaxID=2789856 RepID=A0A7S9QBJ1_9RHOB|nr:FtsX-like permease family protein [Pontivivens ytuae]QPH52943.1 ABC transporter permease [Pontivivens ytuae]